MHRFITSKGKDLWYDVNTNRISLFNPEMEQQACPFVTFIPPTHIKTDKITMFTLEMTQQCNLRCKYCCYSGDYRDRRAHNEKEITLEVLNQAISFIKEHADKESEEITICFYGGEALLAKDKIEWFVAKATEAINKKITFSISTNGLVLTESNIDWICCFDNFLVNVTIDGDKAMHDRNRITKGGKGSYDTIIKNLSVFKEKYPQEYEKRIRFLSTVYSRKDVLEMADTWDKQEVLMNHYPVHISNIIPNLQDQSRTYDSWATKNDFYSKAFDRFRKGEKGILKDCFQRLVGIIEHRDYHKLQETLKIKTCYQELWSCFINVDGDIYACEKFCGEAKAGNVFDGYDEAQIHQLLQKFTDRKNKYCSQCWAQRFCRMCLTSLNHTDKEIKMMCDMERDTIDIALRYFCELKDWEVNNSKIKRIQ